MGHLPGLLAEFSFLVRQRIELFRSFFQSGNLLTALLDFGDLLAELLLSFFERFDRLVLARQRINALFVLEGLAGILHGLGRLIQGGLRLWLSRHGLLSQVIGPFGQTLLLAGQRRQAFGMFGLVGLLSFVPSILLFLDQPVHAFRCLLQGSQRIGALLLRLGDQTIQILTNFIEGVQGLALRFDGVGRCSLAQGVLGLVHRSFRGGDLARQLIDVRLQDILHVARVVREAGLLITHLLRAAQRRIPGPQFILILDARILLSMR